MTGVCGWLSLESGDERDLARMTAALAEFAARRDSRQRSGKGFALGTAGDRGGLSEGEDLALVWSGDLEMPPAQYPGTEIAAAYRERGTEVLSRLEGAFALALVEPREQRALLAIDRMGICSLAYTRIPAGLAFASSLEALVLHPGVRAEVDEQALYNYLFCHMVPAPGTIYKRMWKLLPGQYVSYERGHISTGFYWQLRYRERNVESEPLLAERLRDILRRCVGSCAGEPRTGTFLSGGTDSSAVTGMLSELRSEPVDAYSIGFDAPGYDEMSYAKIAARRYGVRHHAYYVTAADVAAAIPVVARAYDEPFGNASAVPAFYCAKRAAENGIDVMLAGDGGDEIFGGNARYAKQKIFEAYQAIPRPIRNAVVEPIALRAGTSSRFSLARKLHSYVQQARIALPERLESYNLLVRDDPVELFHPDFLAAVDLRQPIESMQEAFDRTASEDPVDRMMHLDLKHTLADNDLRKVNRMCHLARVDVRYPMLRREIVEFSAELPARLKVRGFELRYLFKQALKDVLPPEVLTKEKHGFGLPFGVWLREYRPLADLVQDSLRAFGRRKLMNHAYLEKLLGRHRAGHAAYFGVMIWVIVMLENWLSARRL